MNFSVVRQLGSTKGPVQIGSSGARASRGTLSFCPCLFQLHNRNFTAMESEVESLCSITVFSAAQSKCIAGLPPRILRRLIKRRNRSGCRNIATGQSCPLRRSCSRRLRLAWFLGRRSGNKHFLHCIIGRDIEHRCVRLLAADLRHFESLRASHRVTSLKKHSQVDFRGIPALRGS